MRILTALFFALMLLLNSSSLLGQSTKIPIEWLEFHTDFERKGFAALEQGDTNWLHLLLSTSPQIDSAEYTRYVGRLDDVLFMLNKNDLLKKSPKKIIKKLFNTVHNELLTRYKEENYLHELFESGKYNCVSATSIYSYMLAQLGLSHVLVELPTHVLTVALIEDEQWVLESTDPQQGFYEITNKKQDDFIEMLLNQKMITSDELNSDKRDSLLSFYSEGEAITPSRLIAIQYYNQMLYALEDERFDQAFNYGLKSLYFDKLAPLPGIDAIIWDWIDQENYNNPSFFPIFRYAWSLLDIDLQLEHAITIDYLGEQLKQGNLQDSIFNIWVEFYSKAYPTNDSAQSYVNTRAWVHQGIYALNQGKVLDGLHCANKAMQYNEFDQSARSLIMVCIAQTAHYGLIKEEAIIDSIFDYNKKYESLIDFPLWRNLVADIYIGKAIYHCDRKEFQMAIKYLNAMDELLGGEMPETIQRERVSRAYSKVAHQAFQNNKKHALAWIERGLVYLPDDDLLNNLKDYYSKY